MADLEREKRRLQKEREELEEEGIISFDEVLSAVSKSNVLGGEMPIIVSIASRVAPFAGTFAGPLINIVQNWFANRSEKKEHEHNQSENATKNADSKIKSTLLSLGKDVLGSYLKWKAVELSYRGIKLIVKKQKAKKEQKIKA